MLAIIDDDAEPLSVFFGSYFSCDVEHVPKDRFVAILAFTAARGVFRFLGITNMNGAGLMSRNADTYHPRTRYHSGYPYSRSYQRSSARKQRSISGSSFRFELFTR